MPSNLQLPTAASHLLRLTLVTACALLLPAQAMRSQTEPGLELFNAGSTALSIVVAAQATPAEKDAAAELARYLGRTSGANFPVVSEPHTGPGLFIGRTQQAAAWGLPQPPTCLNPPPPQLLALPSTAANAPGMPPPALARRGRAR